MTPQEQKAKELVEITKNIYAIQVPKDATDFEFLTMGGGIELTKKIPTRYNLYANGILNTPLIHTLLENKPEILGTVDSKIISFDCTRIVESKKHPMFSYTVFRESRNSWGDSPQKSFYFILQSKGIVLTDNTKYLIIT